MFRAVLGHYPRAVMILAPRHPERFAEVAQLMSSSGLPCWRRSQLSPDDVVCGGVLLLDTIGELTAVYAVADLALVGGSLAPRGGHNILEPANFGVPILVGPHTENFRDIIAIFRACQAVRVAYAFTEGSHKADLTPSVLELLGNEQEREALGRRAYETLCAQTGATARSAGELERLLAASPDSAEASPTR
jgi:3-deoxy-D-manno-octulosonic-acid transferase